MVNNRTKINVVNMIYTRLIMIALIVLMFIYYAMVIGQLSGWWKITNRKMKFVNLCVPFYYWVVSQNPKR